MFKKLLCPIDFSPGSDHALKVATRFARRFGSELVLVHAWHLPFSGEYPLPGDAIQAMIDDESARLAAAVAALTRDGVTGVSSCFLTGIPWDRIVDTVQTDPSFDLVVLGTHGRTGLSRVLLGSVAEKVVRHAPISVLVTRGPREVPPFRHILCPIDFSDSSRRALERATELADPEGAGITVEHAVELPLGFRGQPFDAGLVAELDRHGTVQTEAAARALRGKTRVPIATLVGTGSPAGSVLAALDRDPSFDLVTVGSHGRTGIRRILLGSVAENVVRHAPCSVLVAR